MKKSMMVVACMSAALLQGMELQKTLNTENTWSTLIHGAEIRVCKDSIVTAVDKGSWSNNVIIVGENQQELLRSGGFYGSNPWKVGNRELRQDHRVYVRWPSDDSGSEDDTERCFDYYTNTNRYKKTIVNKEFACDVLTIVEPWIKKIKLFDTKHKSVEDFFYDVERINPVGFNTYIPCGFKGDEAVAEASNDLEECYKIAFNKAWDILKDQTFRGIALSTLSADIGFPREKAAAIAIKVVLDFVKKISGKYVCIELFVKKRSDFACYTELLEKYISEQK